MKRLISALLVLLALAAAAFFFVKLRRFLPERSRAAELAPVETVFFAQLPNLRQTALRVPQTDLHQIWQEADVQAFLEKPRQKAPWMREWEEVFEEAFRAAPGEVFLALTSFQGPRYVGGFAFAGSQRQAESVVVKLRKRFLPGTGMVSSVHSNWILFASDAALLGGMMARFDSKGGASLGTDPVYIKSMAPVGVGQDLLLFGRSDSLTGLATGVVAEGATPSAGVAMGTRLDGRRLRDTISLPGGGRGLGLSRQTLALASASTLLYYAGDVTLLQPAADFSGLRSLAPRLPGIEKQLAAKGLTWNDLPLALGPEFGVVVDWPEGAALPTLLLAAEIRDSGKARAFTDVLTSPESLGAAWRIEDHDGVSLASAPPQAFSLVQPSLALTDRFALLGLTSDTVLQALPRAKSSPAAGAEAATFTSTVRSIPAEASGVGYLDFQPLFVRIYRMARPFITLTLAFSPEAGAHYDAGKLPPVESISGHLGPTVFSLSQTEDRTVIESSGSVSLPGLLLGLSAGGKASGLEDLGGLLPGSVKGASPSKQSTPAIPTAPGGGASPGR